MQNYSSFAFLRQRENIIGVISLLAFDASIDTEKKSMPVNSSIAVSYWSVTVIYMHSKEVHTQFKQLSLILIILLNSLRQ